MSEEISARLYISRGLRAEILEEATDDLDAKLELSVDLAAIQVELEQVMLNFDTLPRHCWMPVTTTVGGMPELVYDADDGLIPSLVPIAHLAEEDETVKAEEGVEP